ncbi:hypothetical protein G5I_07696 [Acromyrmex echinatior]|uniref:Shavenoid isoform B-like N-terminal domain-containing protein n=1 Tax=Acromyrmex echinatior TaxID=103372 RepID=F4WPI1_ACREC|nr:hypothetical protein G5I_07696 [Acromyrmex echinatior]
MDPSLRPQASHVSRELASSRLIKTFLERDLFVTYTEDGEAVVLRAAAFTWPTRENCALRFNNQTPNATRQPINIIAIAQFPTPAVEIALARRLLRKDDYTRNAVGKMRSLALVLTSFNLLQVVVRCQELSVIRHSDGDIFTIEGSCTEACTVLSSGTASPFSRDSSSSSLLVPNSSCTCQCNFDLPIFREDLHICVNDIHGGDRLGRWSVYHGGSLMTIATTISNDDDRVEGTSSMNINCAIHSVIGIAISADNDSGSCNTTFGVTTSAGEDGFSGFNARRRGP